METPLSRREEATLLCHLEGKRVEKPGRGEAGDIGDIDAKKHSERDENCEGKEQRSLQLIVRLSGRLSNFKRDSSAPLPSCCCKHRKEEKGIIPQGWLDRGRCAFNIHTQSCYAGGVRTPELTAATTLKTVRNSQGTLCIPILSLFSLLSVKRHEVKLPRECSRPIRPSRGPYNIIRCSSAL